jgi:hypothetical protein
VRASSSGRIVRAKARRGGRGTGAVTATGSYEELPTDGRHPGSSRAGARHGATVTAVSAAPSRPSPKGTRLAKASGTTDGRRRGDRDVRGSIASGAVGRKRPRSARTAGHRRDRPTPPEDDGTKGAHDSDPPKRFGRRESLGPPVKPRRAQTLRGIHAVKAAAANAGKLTRCGCTQVRSGWQKSIGRI